MAITHWQPFQEIDGLELSRWSPMQEIASLQKQMNRLFERLIPTPDNEIISNGESKVVAFIPPAEMEETAEELILKLEIPGLKAQDFDIQVTERSISIAGEKKSETKIEEKGFVRSEFSYGKFRRLIHLPVQIQNEQVKAEYKNGVLQLNLPKVEQQKQKTVKVDVV